MLHRKDYDQAQSAIVLKLLSHRADISCPRKGFTQEEKHYTDDYQQT
jgi:hypothetical protein